MFAYIKGMIQEKETLNNAVQRLVVDCHGFGIELQISQNSATMLPDVNEDVKIYTVFIVKETEFLLFGFATEEEKELFVLLTSVSGIGPKLALALLGTLTSTQLSNAIIEEDEKLITQAPGVGSKVARRIILELKNKIEEWQNKHALEISFGKSTYTKQESIIDDEARTILTHLGYSPSEIINALSIIKKQAHRGDIEEVIRESLKLLAVGNISSLNPNNERIV